ncbi:MAG TPA: T9SS type A sorting domain-containing protein [Bacteroidia bacterium]|nr:T9SS type A sorting domain-containing protein [Bacteroidia bacterium]
MKTKLILTATLVFISLHAFAQGGWTVCNLPPITGGRVDDIFMLDTQTGYAVCGLYILKTTDGGNNWFTVNSDTAQCRSVEFINAQKGFVGAFNATPPFFNRVLRKTLDGGASWTDLTMQIDPRARGGICGLAIPDSNTIYGCGNYYQDSAYIVKSIDGGNTWSFIDMHTYATHLIDMYFLNKDTGFATGTGLPPLRTAVILYTTDGGQTWVYKFQNTIATEWCWKIQHLTDQIYFASIQDATIVPPQILKSTDGGMNWNVQIVDTAYHNIQGVGFIDSLKGWTGGGINISFASNDGGLTWDTMNICPAMNRVFKVNDTLLFATGWQIWKYSSASTGITPAVGEVPQYASLNCNPNPASKSLTMEVTLSKATHALIVLLDETGRRIKLIDNTDKPKGVYQYQLNTDKLSKGIYYVVLKTHEDQQTVKVVVSH